MALREIDRFRVKPSGLFTRWRYKRVMVDENGNLSSASVPGESETMNLPCITDYVKTDRRYKENDLITTFCNLDTHTRFNIYAKNCDPFARVQMYPNSEFCGYQTPLPTPAVPHNPFPQGAPTYGAYAHLNICDDKNVPISIQIYKRGFVGASTAIKNGGKTPAIISYKNNDQDKFAPIRACEFQLTMVSAPGLDAEQFYTQDEREFKVQVTKGGIIKFIGFITPEEATEEFRGGPYDIVIRATDGIGALKKVAYPLPLGSRTDMQQKLIDIITYCFAKTDLNLNIATICNLYETKMLTGLDDDPLAQATVNPLRFTEKGVVLDCYKVLEIVAKQFGAFVVQDNGIWNFVRVNELTYAALRRRVYLPTGLFLTGEQISNRRIATCKGDDISMLDEKPMLRIGNAYKRAEVSVDFGQVPLILYNGDFELWDGFNFTGWTKYGGIDVTRVENKIVTANGFVFSGDYALEFNKVADNSKYISPATVLVNGKDALSLTFNVGQTPVSVNGFKLRIKLNNYYLTNPAGDNNYVWVNSLVTCTIPIKNPNGNINSYLVDLAIPEAPISGEMVLQFFGFVQNVATPGNYFPIGIDNVSIKRSGDAESTGRSMYLAEQDGFFTTKPEETKLLFGDFAERIISRPSRADDPQSLLNDYYAIRTADGSYSTNWYEYGGTGSISGLPIGLVLAKNILKQYQKPFRFLESNFFGTDISYLDVINVSLPDDEKFSARIFTLLSGDFDLVSRELRNAVYAEIFEKEIKTVQLQIPGKVSSLYPPIVQNPNPTPTTTGGIFKTPFVQEFE